VDQDAQHGGAAATVVERLVDVGIDGIGPFASAQAVADAARRDNPDVEQAIDAVVRQHVVLAAAGGFLTGVGGLFTLPVALPANVVGFYAVATRMVAATAALRGYDLHEDGVRSAVMLTLVGAEAEDLLRKVGVPTSGRLTGLATQRLPGPAAMVVNKAIGFRLLTATGRSTFALLGRGLPVAGGLLGAGVDGLLMRELGQHARRELPPHADAVVR